MPVIIEFINILWFFLSFYVRSNALQYMIQMLVTFVFSFRLKLAGGESYSVSVQGDICRYICKLGGVEEKN